MNVKIDVSEGEFEILVSQQTVPDENNYEFKFLKDHFSVNFNKSPDYKHVFFTILAVKQLVMSMIVILAEPDKKEGQQLQAKIAVPTAEEKANRLKYVDKFPDFDARVQKYPTEIGNEITCKLAYKLYRGYTSKEKETGDVAIKK